MFEKKKNLYILGNKWHGRLLVHFILFFFILNDVLKCSVQFNKDKVPKLSILMIYDKSNFKHTSQTKHSSYMCSCLSDPFMML